MGMARSEAQPVAAGQAVDRPQRRAAGYTSYSARSSGALGAGNLIGTEMMVQPCACSVLFAAQCIPFIGADSAAA